MSDSPAASSSPKNQQFSRLNSFRRERMLVDIYLVSGVRLRGRIKSFDQYSLILDVGQGETFLYHHAVSSIGPVQGKGAHPPKRFGAGDAPRSRGEGRGEGRGPAEPRSGDGRGDAGGRDGGRDFGRADPGRGVDHDDSPPPMRRPLGAPKPASEVTVVRRVSRKITLPPKDDPSGS